MNPIRQPESTYENSCIETTPGTRIETNNTPLPSHAQSQQLETQRLESQRLESQRLEIQRIECQGLNSQHLQSEAVESLRTFHQLNVESANNTILANNNNFSENINSDNKILPVFNAGNNNFNSVDRVTLGTVVTVDRKIVDGAEETSGESTDSCMTSSDESENAVELREITNGVNSTKHIKTLEPEKRMNSLEIEHPLPKKSSKCTIQ